VFGQRPTTTQVILYYIILYLVVMLEREKPTVYVLLLASISNFYMLLWCLERDLRFTYELVPHFVCGAK